MRTLTSIQSATNITGDLTWRLTLSDQSTTFVFDRGDMVDMTPISYEIPFGGGFGKPSNYRITLQSSIGWIKAYRQKAINGEASITVTANSDSFTPMIGRVRNLTRYPNNPNLIEFQVYETTLDTNPMIPRESIVDSYTPRSFDYVHPDVIAADMGYPLYYGKHTRPFYMTSVTCHCQEFLGPRNVSSANHVTSIWYSDDMTKPFSGAHWLLTSKKWQQQSTSNNLAWTGAAFEVIEYDSEKPQIASFIYPTVQLSYHDYNPKDDERRQNARGPQTYSGKKITFQYFNQILYPGGYTRTFWNIQRLKKIIRAPIHKVSGMNFRTSFEFAFMADWLDLYTFSFSGSGIIKEPIATWSNINTTTLTDSAPMNLPNALFDDHINVHDFPGIELLSFTDSFTTNYFVDYNVTLRASLRSSAYTNYSVFGTQQNCAEIAISENPYGILYDLISNHSSLSLVTAQCSAAQAAAGSYNFQCFLGEKQPITDIMAEFGRTTATYLWVGDSGSINFRAYQQSASTIHDAVITTSDYLRDTFTIKDNPLGTTVYDVRRASRVKIDYDYNHQTRKYDNSMTATRFNNDFCNSAYHAGIQDEITLRTQYIKETATASLYIANIIRNVTQDEQIVEMRLPARYYSLELADIVKVQHPILENSESLYQITRIEPNYMTGIVRIAAAQIKNI